MQRSESKRPTWQNQRAVPFCLGCQEVCKTVTQRQSSPSEGERRCPEWGHGHCSFASTGVVAVTASWTVSVFRGIKESFDHLSEDKSLCAPQSTHFGAGHTLVIHE